jgi:basic amino acid/polyamine antiporter, APA family
VAVVAVVLLLALLLPLVQLAAITGTLLLLVYTMVNISLWRMKRRRTLPDDEEAPNYPAALPLVAAIVCLLFLGFNLATFAFDLGVPSP